MRKTTQESFPKARMSGIKCCLLLVILYLCPREIAVQVLSEVTAKEILPTQTEHKKEINQGWWPLEKCMLRHLEVALATARLCVHKIQIILREYHNVLHSWNVEFSVTLPPLWLKAKVRKIYLWSVSLSAGSLTNLQACASSLRKRTTTLWFQRWEIGGLEAGPRAYNQASE